MKKILFCVLLVCVIGAAAWYLLKAPSSALLPSALLPADTLLFLETKDLEKQIDEFKTGRLGKNLSSIDWISVLHKLNVPQQDIADFERMKSKFLASLDTPLFKEIFGQEATLAVLPSIREGTHPDGFVLPDHTVIISRPKHNAKLIEFVGQFMPGELDAASKEYHGHTIHRLLMEMEEPPVYTATIKGLTITSTGMKQIETCLDTASGLQPSLETNPYYKDLRNRLNSSSKRIFSYVNIRDIVREAHALLPQTVQESDRRRLVELYLNTLGGFNAVGTAAYNDGSELLQTKVLVQYDKAHLAHLYQKTVSIQPGKNLTLQMIPQNPLIYYWTNTLDLKASLDDQLSDEQTRRKFRKELEKSYDIDLDDLTDAFGHQLGLVLDDIQTGGLFPAPNFSLFVEIKDEKIIRQLMNSIVQKTHMLTQQETFEDTEINSIVLPLGGNIQPAYAFFNNFFMLSSSPELIKQMIRTHTDGNTITTSEDFLTVCQDFKAMNNAVVFINNADLIDKTQAVIDWSSNILFLNNPGKAAEIRIVIKDIVHPVLDGLKMYDTIGLQTVIGENITEIDTVYQVFPQ